MRAYLLISSLILCGFLTFSLSAQNKVGPGNSVVFDGVDDRIDLGTDYNQLSFPLTVMAWVKPVFSDTVATIFSSNSLPTFTDYHGITLSIRSGRIAIGYGDGTAGFSQYGRRGYEYLGAGFDSQWIHVTGIMIGPNNARLYINGIEVNGSPTGQSNSPISLPLNGHSYIGYKQKNENQFYKGEIDEVRVWSRAISVQEIRENMCQKVKPNSPGLIMAFDLNEEQTSSTLANAAGNGQAMREGGAVVVSSGAPVGDTAVFDVGNYQNTTKTLSLGAEQVTVTGLGLGTQGVQFYKMRGDTLPTDQCGDTSVYGLFLMRQNPNISSNFDMNFGAIGQVNHIRTHAADVWWNATGSSYWDRVEWAPKCVTDLVEDATIFIPNVFTPNADNLNDSFVYTGCEGYYLEMEIFNRWGNVVFHTQQPNVFWDGTVGGKPAAEGVYLYTLTIRDDLGGVKNYKGVLHLLR